VESCTLIALRPCIDAEARAGPNILVSRISALDIESSSFRWSHLGVLAIYFRKDAGVSLRRSEERHFLCMVVLVKTLRALIGHLHVKIYLVMAEK
jgi:hypothetical protein